LAGAVERTAPAIVTVHARRRLPSTGIHWRPGVIVTADHTVRAEEDITVTTPDGRALPAVLAGRDPGNRPRRAHREGRGIGHRSPRR
jgi:S1-C subfamily serine protease